MYFVDLRYLLRKIWMKDLLFVRKFEEAAAYFLMMILNNSPKIS
jgi:hypothetical protein